MMHYLYRNSTLWATTLLLMGLLCPVSGLAQIRDRTQHQTADEEQNQSKVNDRPKKRGPRAIAVLEFTPGKGTRLVPVALWIDGHYNDASLYGARPEPMALEPDTVYEVFDTGEPAGWFTVTAPHEDNGSWVADGQWKPRRVVDEQLAAQAAKQPKKKAPSLSGDDQGPPVLRRPSDSGSSTSTSDGSSSRSSSGNSGASSSSGNSRSASNAPPSGDDDPDRPTLKKPQPAAPSADANHQNEPGNPGQSSNTASNAKSNSTAGSTMATDESDPNRPVLRRGKAAAGSAAGQTSQSSTGSVASLAPAKAGSDGKAASARIPSPNDQKPRSLAAISDAGTTDSRSLLYALSQSEREKQIAQMSGLAMDELRKFSSQHNLAPPPKTATLTDTDLHAFDLEFSNSPTLVFSAVLPVSTPKPHGPSSYFVTVVAREDINGIPQKIFASVTANNYLDAFPRMQLVDAVDADANGRGDLLFRQSSDSGIAYSLYRVYPYQMVKIFEGGASL